MKKKRTAAGDSSKPRQQPVKHLPPVHLKPVRSEPGPAKKPAPAEPDRLLYEFQVHQIELELQNEELARSRAKAETELARYTDLFEFAPVGYLTLARGGVIREINLTGSRLFRQDRSHLVGKPLGPLLSPHSRMVLAAFLARAFERGTREACEVEISVKGSGPLFVELSGTGADEGRECWVAATDITPRIATRRALQASERRYGALFKKSRDALMTLAPPDWTYTSGNPAALALFGAGDEADFVASSPAAYSPVRQPDGQSSEEKLRAMFEIALREGSHAFEWTYQRLSGVPFNASVLLTRTEVDGIIGLQATVWEEVGSPTLEQP